MRTAQQLFRKPCGQHKNFSYPPPTPHGPCPGAWGQGLGPHASRGFSSGPSGLPTETTTYYFHYYLLPLPVLLLLLHVASTSRTTLSPLRLLSGSSSGPSGLPAASDAPASTLRDPRDDCVFTVEARSSDGDAGSMRRWGQALGRGDPGWRDVDVAHPTKAKTETAATYYSTMAKEETPREAWWPSSSSSSWWLPSGGWAEPEKDKARHEGVDPDPWARTQPQDSGTSPSTWWRWDSWSPWESNHWWTSPRRWWYNGGWETNRKKYQPPPTSLRALSEEVGREDVVPKLSTTSWCRPPSRRPSHRARDCVP